MNEIGVFECQKLVYWKVGTHCGESYTLFGNFVVLNYSNVTWKHKELTEIVQEWKSEISYTQMDF